MKLWRCRAIVIYITIQNDEEKEILTFINIIHTMSRCYYNTKLDRRVTRERTNAKRTIVFAFLIFNPIPSIIDTWYNNMCYAYVTYNVLYNSVWSPFPWWRNIVTTWQLLLSLVYTCSLLISALDQPTHRSPFEEFHEIVQKVR